MLHVITIDRQDGGISKDSTFIWNSTYKFTGLILTFVVTEMSRQTYMRVHRLLTGYITTVNNHSTNNGKLTSYMQPSFFGICIERLPKKLSSSYQFLINHLPILCTWHGMCFPWLLDARRLTNHKTLPTEWRAHPHTHERNSIQFNNFIFPK
jgi:hypothetical protein